MVRAYVEIALGLLLMVWGLFNIGALTLQLLALRRLFTRSANKTEKDQALLHGILKVMIRNSWDAMFWSLGSMGALWIGNQGYVLLLTK